MPRKRPPPSLGQRGGARGLVPAPQQAAVGGARLGRQIHRLGLARLVERGGAALRRRRQRSGFGEVPPAQGARVPPGGEVLRREPAGDEGVEVARPEHVGAEVERGVRVRRGLGEGDLGPDPAELRGQRRVDVRRRGEARDLPALDRVVVVAEADEPRARDRAERRQHAGLGPEAGGVDHQSRRGLRRQVYRAVGGGDRERKRRARRAAAQQDGGAGVAGREAREQRRRGGPALGPGGEDGRSARPQGANQHTGAAGPGFGQRAQPRAGVLAQRGAAAGDLGREPQRGFLALRLERAPDLAGIGLAQRGLEPGRARRRLRRQVEGRSAGRGRGHRAS